MADNEFIARDACEKIEVSYTPFPAAASIDDAMAPGAAIVWPDFATNLAFTQEMGDRKACEAIFARAAKTARVKIINNRVSAHYMEPRAAIAEYDAKAKSFTLTATSQGVHGLRDTLADMRAAINAPLQGSAADIIKVAMLRVDTLLTDSYPDAHLILQIHDELLIEAKDQGPENNKKLINAVQNTMEEVMRLQLHPHPVEFDMYYKC